MLRTKDMEGYKKENYPHNASFVMAADSGRFFL